MSKNASIDPSQPLEPPDGAPDQSGGQRVSDLLVTAAVPVVTAAPSSVPADVAQSAQTGEPAVEKTAIDPYNETDPVSYEMKVQCPSCHTVWEGNDVRPHAEWFCDNCDYPLFWVLPPSGNEVIETGRSLSRLPGTDGRDALVSMACPHCGERNPPVPTADCLRCGLPLTIGKAPSPPEPVIITVQAPPPPPVKPRRIWPWVVAACVFATAFLVTLIILVND